MNSIADRALAHVEHLAVQIGSRPIGSPANLAAAQYIAGVFSDRGGVSSAGDLLLAPIVETVKERVHVIPLDKVEFVFAELGIDGGLAGAALWAKRRQEQF